VRGSFRTEEEDAMNVKRISLTGSLAALAMSSLVLGVRKNVDAAAPTGGPPVLMIKEQGSFFVGGQPFFSEHGNDTNEPSSRNPGTATINQAYVEYQIPHIQKSQYPIILYPGGGHGAKVYETTPDGREGWTTYFLRLGFPVYAVDGVNRGGSSYDMTNIALAVQGRVPASDLPRMNRYTRELAWTQFRIGPTPGVPFPTTQFPTAAFDQYANQLIPAWRDAIEDDKNVAALVALLDRTGPAILLTWSQSGRFGVRAAVQRPNLVKAIVSLEPASVNAAGDMAGITAADLARLSHIPIALEVGDFDPPRISSLRNFAAKIGPNATVLSLTERGIYGNGHVVMVEKNNIQVADLFVSYLRGVLRLR
jgi:pimeloyl-ACP methyl ester carboxylesterase